MIPLKYIYFKCFNVPHGAAKKFKIKEDEWKKMELKLKGMYQL